MEDIIKEIKKNYKLYKKDKRKEKIHNHSKELTNGSIIVGVLMGISSFVSLFFGSTAITFIWFSSSFFSAPFIIFVSIMYSSALNDYFDNNLGNSKYLRNQRQFKYTLSKHIQTLINSGYFKNISKSNIDLINEIISQVFENDCYFQEDLNIMLYTRINEMLSDMNDYSEKEATTLLSMMDKESKEYLDIAARYNNIDIDSLKETRTIHEQVQQKKIESDTKEKDEQLNKAFQQLKESLTIINQNSQADDKLLERLSVNKESLENMLFEEIGQCKIIRRQMIEFLPYFDLSIIDFSNVDVRNISFKGTNAKINPQKVYLKSLYNCNLNGIDFSPFSSSFNGCDLRGSIIDDWETNIDLNSVIVDERTVLASCQYEEIIYKGEDAMKALSMKISSKLTKTI